MFTKALSRLLDIIFSILFLILFSPIILLIIISIKVLDGGSIFADNCQRIGLNGKVFTMYKFRSMVENAHIDIQRDPKLNKLKKIWLKRKLQIGEDPRITKVGSILRRLDIDEIAQFLNVLKGDMAIVGPRPFYPEEFETSVMSNKMFRKISKRILSVKPGITGLWQVSGRNSLSLAKRLKLDLKYVEKKNLVLDFWIVLKTPYVIFKHILSGE